ncbi:Alpha/Beta hydrolase protein [Diaporthe sp. PMI_573]|nr:Alpha/Beta hydrolase protein [Diaporthaceae sp. PMI_573]
MSPENPVFVLAHGAWHPAQLYDPLKDALAKLGYTLAVPALPTTGPDAKDITWEADVEALLQTAEPLFSQGKKVVLIGHSYGGIPACIATRENGVAERRARGLNGGFIHIGFLCAFTMPSRGISQMELMQHQLPPWQGHVIESGCIKQLVVNQKAKSLLYNDLSTEVAEKYFNALVPQSWAAMEKPVDFSVPEITIPKTYIICDDDQAFPKAAQHYWSDTLGLPKVSVSGGHAAFASVPDELASVLVGLVE